MRATFISRTTARAVNLGSTESDLTAQFVRSQRRRMLKAVAFIVPALFYLLLFFVIPIVSLLFRAVENPELEEAMPVLAKSILAWDGITMPPPPEVLKAFAVDLTAAYQQENLGKVAMRLNREVPTFHSMLFKTARRMPPPDDLTFFNKLVEIDHRWADRRIWVIIKRAAMPFTLSYLLRAIDKEYNVEGKVVSSSPETSIYLLLFWRTVWISLVVTFLCVVIGYPVAYVLSTSNPGTRNFLILLLLLAFWTSLLVRTTAWIVILQERGLANQFLQSIGLITQPLRLIRNRLGVYIAMTHILLPFTVLPIFSVMSRIPPIHMRAAASLGAKPVRAFLKVYLPQTLPGVGAGVLLVFIMSLGFYITPALVGGPQDQMISYYIVFNAIDTMNWGLAAALSIVLLICVGLFLVVFSRFVRIDQIGLR
jgi:putative spermidine/putrescine transport system permease protein